MNNGPAEVFTPAAFADCKASQVPLLGGMSAHLTHHRMQDGSPINCVPTVDYCSASECSSLVRAPNSRLFWRETADFVSDKLAGRCDVVTMQSSSRAVAEARRYLGVAHGLQAPDLIDLGVDELLAAKSGVDAHDEHQVHNLNHLHMQALHSPW